MICKRCGVDRPITHYYVRGDKLRSPCRFCQTDASKARYHKNKPTPYLRTASLAIALHRDGESATESIARALRVQFKSRADEMAALTASIRVMVERALGE